MKSVILHGDDNVASRKRLNELILEAKGNGWDITRLDGNSVTRDEILVSGRSQGLLAANQLIVIENLFSSNSRVVDALAELAKYEGVVLLVWEGKKIDGRKLRKFEKNFKIEPFNIPAVVFNFLDSIVPGNARASLKLLRKASREEAEFLLFMLAARIRQLIWIKENPQSLKLPDWQKRKLARQAKAWQTNKLYQFHSKLLELDRMNKRSLLPENLFSSLDLLIAGF